MHCKSFSLNIHRDIVVRISAHETMDEESDLPVTYNTAIGTLLALHQDERRGDLEATLSARTSVSRSSAATSPSVPPKISVGPDSHTLPKHHSPKTTELFGLLSSVRYPACSHAVCPLSTKSHTAGLEPNHSSRMLLAMDIKVPVSPLHPPTPLLEKAFE